MADLKQKEQEQELDQMAQMSIEDMFGGVTETYEEAEQRAIEESSSGLKVDYFRPDKLGVYSLRFAPIAPAKNGEKTRGGYEYPAHNMLIKINNPEGKEKKPFYVSIVRATECGLSTDVIDVYRKLAVEEAKARGDQDLADKISGGSYGGGLRYDYQHLAYVIDMDERAKGFQLYAMSHGQFKDLDDAKRTMWKKLHAKKPSAPCPISHFLDAYVVELEKKKDGKKTVYKYSIDNVSDMEPLTVEELTKLMAAPRIDEVVFRYNRRHHEAVQVFLKQCDSDYDMDIFNHQEVQGAIEAINAEIPASDTSSFTFDSKEAQGKVTIDTLYAEYDELEAKGLGDKTEEGQELRSKIRDFMKDNDLEDVITIGRSTTNIEILDALSDEIEENGETVSEDNEGSDAIEKEPEAEPEEKDEPEETERPVRRGKRSESSESTEAHHQAPDSGRAPRERRTREGRPARR